MKTLLTLNEIYYLIGFILMLLVGMTLRDKGNPKRLTTALFWFLFGSVFLFSDLLVATLGKPMAYRIVGAIVVLISLIAGGGLLSIGTYKQSSPEQRQASANKLRNWLFVPAMLIPVVTVLCTVFLKGVAVGGVYLLDQKQLTLASLCVACVSAILAGWWVTGGTPFV